MTDPARLYVNALQHLSAGRLIEAISVCRQILKLVPNHTDTLNVMGLALLRDRKPEKALSSFKKALKSAPSSVPIHLNCGLAWSALDRRDRAEQSFKNALSHDPHSAEAHFQLGLLLQNRFKFDDAIMRFRRVLEIDSRHATAHAVLGEALVLQGKFEEAKQHLKTAVDLNPKLTSVYDNLGVIAENQGRRDEALGCFAKALEINPDFAGSHFNRAVTLLRRGDFKNGLTEYEWRWLLPKTRLSTHIRPFAQPRWQGEPLEGRKLLVWGEQGVGDEIRLAALVRDLSEKSEHVILECDRRLKPLFERSFPDTKIVPRRDPAMPATMDQTIAFQCPAESLVPIVRPDFSRFPQRTKYLVADPERTDGFRAVLSDSAAGRPVIGLSWGSYNPQLQLGKTTALRDWSPILNDATKYFVGLQYGDIKKERDDVEKAIGASMTLLPDLDLIKDMDGLAALISACDLVITVSNTTAHLAGALGIPTWVLLPFGHFQPWYWFLDRADSPWYPSVKLYRQRKFGDWPNVLAQVAHDLSVWANKR